MNLDERRALLDNQIVEKTPRITPGKAYRKVRIFLYGMVFFTVMPFVLVLYYGSPWRLARVIGLPEDIDSLWVPYGFFLLAGLCALIAIFRFFRLRNFLP